MPPSWVAQIEITPEGLCHSLVFSPQLSREVIEVPWALLCGIWYNGARPQEKKVGKEGKSVGLSFAQCLHMPTWKCLDSEERHRLFQQVAKCYRNGHETLG